MTRQFSAGGVVFKRESGILYFLLIQPKPSLEFPKIRFSFPKGLIEPNEKTEDAAVREVLEETRVEARIIDKLDNVKMFFKIQNEPIFKIVTYFLMEYVSGESKPQSEEISQILWLPFEEAKKTLSYSSDKKILEKANDLLKSL